MRNLIPVLSLFLSALIPANLAAADAGTATVTVGPKDNGDWEVAYTFDTPQSVVVLARSNSDYRGATWTLETEDARFGRLGGFDTVVFDEPSKSLTFSIIPLTSKLVGDYTPFVTFSDGGLAVYEGQFSLVAFEAPEDVEALNGDLNNSDAGQLPLTLKLSHDGPIVVDGQTLKTRLTHKVIGDGTYIYLGNSAIETHDSFATVLDTSLPDWLGDRFDEDLARIFSDLETLWGFQLSDKATVMLAYKGTSGQGFSATGGALDNLLMMEVGGADLNAPDFNTLSYLQWFFAHEAVHLFQSAKGVEFSNRNGSWIHEGAANTMAYGLIAAQLGEEDGPKFLQGVYSNAFAECRDALRGGPLNTVTKRDKFSAHYACGDLIALATDGFLKRRTLYEFWNTLTDNAAKLDEKQIDTNLYFTTLQLLGATRAQREIIRNIVEEKTDDPSAALTDMLEKAGLAPEFSSTGELVKMDWPVYAAE